jgi:hypothetical protein
MNKKEAYQEGFDRGYEAATYCEVEDGDEDKESAAFEAEENARQYSPFEFLAHDINETGDRADGLWEAYDKGVAAGIKAALKGK